MTHSQARNCCCVQLSPECVAAAEGVDLIVMEGMGRAIETNLNATFSCDSLKLAMVKHPEVCLPLCCLQAHLTVQQSVKVCRSVLASVLLRRQQCNRCA